jgi:hypothetical protein
MAALFDWFRSLVELVATLTLNPTRSCSAGPADLERVINRFSAIGAAPRGLVPTVERTLDVNPQFDYT